MKYRKTKLCLPKKNAPLDVKDLIQRQVEREDTTSIEYPKPSSTTLVDALKPSVGLWNLIRQFAP